MDDMKKLQKALEDAYQEEKIVKSLKSLTETQLGYKVKKLGLKVVLFIYLLVITGIVISLSIYLAIERNILP